MDNTIKIRDALVADAEALSALCITVWIDTYSIGGIEPSHASYALSEFSSANIILKINHRQVYVAERDGKLVAVAVFNAETGEIETLYVLPQCKGSGLGKALITAIRDNFRQKLYLTCWEENAAAVAFYKKQGFIETGEYDFQLDGKSYRNIELSLL